VIREAREHQQLPGLTRHLNANSTVGREAGKGRHGSQRGPEGMGALGALETRGSGDPGGQGHREPCPTRKRELMGVVDLRFDKGMQSK